MRRKTTVCSLAICATLAIAHPSSSQQDSKASASLDALAQGFLAPPDEAKPRTWWHWTNGNVSEAGITKDLEWMKRAGIGGFQLSDVAYGSGQSVEPKINFATPEWYHAVMHSAEDAKRLGLEMSIFSCAGWSEAGGPWVKPEMAMKKLVSSETIVEGATRVHVKLPQPPSNDGPVRDSGAQAGTPHFYADSAVIGYRTPAEDIPMASLHPKITTNNGPIDGHALLDDALATSITLAGPKDNSPAWLQYEFARPYTARALSFGSHGHIPVGRVLASDDGVSFRTVIDLPGPQGYHGASIRTFAFPAVTAKFFRIELSGASLTPAAVIHGAPVVPASSFNVSEAIFSSGARVNRWEDKGAFGSLMDVYDVVPTPSAPTSAEIPAEDVLDLTAKMQKDGTLDWDAPAGHWTVMRMGYSLTGAKNRPSVPAGSGYEVDKLSAKYVRQYFNAYIDPLQQHLGSLLGSVPHYLTMDSWEAGMQNWTDDMLAEFERRRGYSPVTYLPVLAGHVVKSADVSDRFLWDFRRTLADMYADEFYGTMDQELHKKGMEAYAEASGVALEIPEDTLLNKSKVDIPMAEFWVHALHPESMYYVDVRGAASTAHVYGKRIVAAESFTGGGYESPFTLKKIADYWFAQGVNRLVFHTSAHQPLDTKPGNVMVGTHINRNMTWAEQARPFMTYLSRVSYMLQQGSSVADIAYLLPEGAPSTMPFWGDGLQPAPPPGYDFDVLNTDILLHHTSVNADGSLHVEGSAAMLDGMNYRLLVLPQTTRMTPEVLGKIRELVSAGATITGPRPTASPSLLHFPESDLQVHSFASDLWGAIDGVTLTEHSFGKGTTYSGLSLEEILARLNTPRDFASSGALANPPAWVHRRTRDTDVYFVANQTDQPQHIDARFRVNGKQVQVWRPMVGAMADEPNATSSTVAEEHTGNRQAGLQPALYRAESEFTDVPLDLAERESVFVVFGDASHPANAAPARVESTVSKLPGPWKITFPDGLGAPHQVSMPSLVSWTLNPDPGVKYFSGTAIYSKMVQASPAWFHRGEHIFLDLTQVRDIAEVRVNGKLLGELWAPPYRLDVTSALKPGANSIEIKVTNEWTNRLLGDRLVPPGQRVFPTASQVTRQPGGRELSTQPVESGLIGEVSLKLAR